MRSACMAVVSMTLALSIALLAQAPGQAGRGGRGQVPNPTHSRIKVYDLATKTLKEMFSADGYFESPDFSADGKFIRFTTPLPTRKLFHLPVTGGQAIEVGAGFPWGHDRARNKDGSRQASGSPEGAMVFLGPNYTNPKLAGGPFYLHTISPDGEWLAGSCGGRVCRIRWPGGTAFEMLTTVAGNDNSDYSADGKFIYFESNRSGKREIWRMPADGAGPEDTLAERVSDEPGPIRFPHPSPDGKWIVFMVAKPGGDARDVTLRMIPTPGAKAVPTASQELLSAVGGQGMMHRNSWSPDSTKIAFASFEP